MRSKFKVLKNGLVDNLCPCRDNQERGLICAHLVAMGMEVIRRNADPELQEKANAELRRAERLEKASEKKFIQRTKKSDPDALPARLVVELADNWQEQVLGGRVGLFIHIETDEGRALAAEVSTDTPFSFSHRDENLLYMLEDLCGGPVKSELQLPIQDFINLLRLHQGKPMFRQGRDRGITVNSGAISSVMEMDLDRDNGELLLTIHTETSDDEELSSPFYIIGTTLGWVFSGDRFWPLSDILPRTLHEIYLAPVRIPRETVPAFLMTELAQIEKYMVVRSAITPDLFFMKPAKPKFHLVLKGSPASLAATLYARYNDEIELVAGRADMRGNFAIPDARDLLKYRIRNMAAEKQAVQKLEAVGFVGRAGDTLRNIVGPREVLNFLGSGVPRIRRMGWQVELEGRIKPF
ncbi:MAG: SNF2 helicase associated domain-containing protein, partial [Kiritimatiellales bacterium]|nr:SNF2 helicase associated domain-containing protein [Kiritimatiellales bacterium]